MMMRNGSSNGQNIILQCPNSPKRFKVAIIETLELDAEVEASSHTEAEQIVASQWENNEYVLDGSDFSGVEFRAALVEE